MLINLPDNVVNLFRLKAFRAKIRVLETKASSTFIEIKGQRLSVPFVLSKEKKYSALLENGRLKIVENDKDKGDGVSNDEQSRDLIKDFLFNDDKVNYNGIDLLLNFFKERKKIIDDDKDIFFKDKEGNYRFIFDLPFYNSISKIFIKISNSNDIFLDIFNQKDIKKDLTDKFKKELSDFFQIKGKKIKIKISQNKNDFFDSLPDFSKNVDLKV
ncbi:MAG TPA: hypothetical protein PLO89_08495 [Spirochaetota bacterium]|nr:hypothetical protein [Spirochaetota bacterium]